MLSWTMASGFPNVWLKGGRSWRSVYIAFECIPEACLQFLERLWFRLLGPKQAFVQFFGTDLPRSADLGVLLLCQFQLQHQRDADRDLILLELACLIREIERLARQILPEIDAEAEVCRHPELHAAAIIHAEFGRSAAVGH